MRKITLWLQKPKNISSFQKFRFSFEKIEPKEIFVVSIISLISL